MTPGSDLTVNTKALTVTKPPSLSPSRCRSANTARRFSSRMQNGSDDEGSPTVSRGIDAVGADERLVRRGDSREAHRSPSCHRCLCRSRRAIRKSLLEPRMTHNRPPSCTSIQQQTAKVMDKGCSHTTTQQHKRLSRSHSASIPEGVEI